MLMTANTAANAIIGQQADEAKRLQTQLEALRAGYTALWQLVEAYSMVHDVDVDWDKFPEETLAYAHQEITALRTELKTTRIDKARLDWLDRNAIIRDRTLAIMEREANHEPIRWAGIEWDGQEVTIRQAIDEVTKPN